MFIVTEKGCKKYKSIPQLVFQHVVGHQKHRTSPAYQFNMQKVKNQINKYVLSVMYLPYQLSVQLGTKLN
jgi:hypothetical protein